MIYELLVTSAKRALQAGRSGFAAVMRTRGMHPELQSRLEALSGYRHLFPQGDPRNPVVHSHSVIDSVAGRFSVFSRTLDAGSDYSGRSNKLAHHLAFDASEIRNAARSSPAAALQSLERGGRFASRWEGDPREQEPASPVAFPPSEPAKCVAWETIAGDAGWAGVLLERTLKGLSTWLIVPAGVDPIGLFVEAMALMEPSKRWAISFTTHAMSDTGFAWKATTEGSAEAKGARERTPAAVIDLTQPATAGEGGPYAQAARGLADVPWKKSVTAKPGAPNQPVLQVRSSGESPSAPAPAIHLPEAAGTPPALRSAPPPLVKPPLVARPPNVLGDTRLFPGSTSGPLVDRGNTPLIASAFAVGITVAVLLGLLLDAQIRGERSVIRKIAALVPNEQGEQQPRGDGNTPPSPPPPAGPHDGGSDSKVIEAPPPASTAPATPSLPPPSQPSPSGDESLSATNTADNPINKPEEGSFQPLLEAVESQGHLPDESLWDIANAPALPQKSTFTLVVFGPQTASPSIDALLLLPSSSRLTLDSPMRSGTETRWTCRMTHENSNSLEVGTFLLTGKEISFEAAATGQDAVERLSRCCLLFLGKNNSEATYLQLSKPKEIEPIPFTLEHCQRDPQGVLQAVARLPLPPLEDLDDGQRAGEISLRITATTVPDKTLFTFPMSLLTLPLVGQQVVCFALEPHQAQMVLDYEITTAADFLTLALVAGPFADKAQFDRLCKAISSGRNINFEQVLWPFVRSELRRALPKAEEREGSGTTNNTRQDQALSWLRKILEPPKAAAPLATYINTLRAALAASPSLTARAESIVDKKHPPPAPEQAKGDSTGRNSELKDNKEEPPFDRDAEVTREKETQFSAWCEERLNQLEVQRQKRDVPDGHKWTDEDCEDYAALYLWLRLQHLEECVETFRLPETPDAITGAARIEVRRLWPTDSLPPGVSCRPETLLLRTCP